MELELNEYPNHFPSFKQFIQHLLGTSIIARLLMIALQWFVIEGYLICFLSSIFHTMQMAKTSVIILSDEKVLVTSVILAFGGILLIKREERLRSTNFAESAKMI